MATLILGAPARPALRRPPPAGIDGIGADEGFGEGQAATMIPASSGARVWLAAGHTDMRKGFDGLAKVTRPKSRKVRKTGQSEEGSEEGAAPASIAKENQSDGEWHSSNSADAWRSPKSVLHDALTDCIVAGARQVSRPALA
jgi:hypothetical protein